MARYRLNLADPADDDYLRAVLAATPMPGRVTVGFQREPSYFGGAVVDGRFRRVVAARDAASNRLVGFGSRSVLDRYVNGSAMPIGYLSSLRVLPNHRRGLLVARGQQRNRRRQSTCGRKPPRQSSSNLRIPPFWTSP